MREFEILRARVEEIVIDHDYRLLKVLDSDENEYTLRLDKSSKIINDENYNEVSLQNLSINLPIYVYFEKVNSLSSVIDPLLIVLAQNEDNLSQVIGYFDDELYNKDYDIRINEASLKLVETLDRYDFLSSHLKNRNLIVFYQVTTRSIPAIISPIKIFIVD